MPQNSILKIETGKNFALPCATRFLQFVLGEDGQIWGSQGTGTPRAASTLLLTS